MARYYDWQVRAHSSSLVRPAIEMPDVIWRLLSSRGFERACEIHELLGASLKNMTSPSQLHDMDKAVSRLVQALRQQEKICLYADFDLDGTSGLALLLSGLKKCGYKDILYYQPKRLSEGYGLHGDAIEKLAKEQSVNVVVSIDVGITAIEAARRAKELGVDLIITDHHLPKETLPAAYAIVNPNSGLCGSDLGYLCGTGVAFYLLLALKSELKKQSLLAQDFDAKSFLDCFAIGTLTDMVPLVNENRSLVKHGLLALADTKRPGLKALMQELGLWGKTPTASDVAIRFAPKLNALSRLEMDILPIDIYLETDEKRAQYLVSKVLKNNDKRIHLQRSAELEAFEKCFDDHEHFVWVYSKNFHKGIVGLVATKLSQHYSVPAYVGCLDKRGFITGSARLPSMSEGSLVEAMSSASGYLERFGGHAPAAGFVVAEKNSELFRESLRQYYRSSPKDEFSVPKLHYDCLCDLSEIDPLTMEWLDRLGPFGSQFEPPTFRFNELQLMNLRSLKGGHFKLSVKEEITQLVREVLWFSPNEEHPFFSKEFVRGATVDIIAEPQWNYYQDRKTIQFLLKDIHLY